MDKINIDPGTIEKKTLKKTSYKVDYPTFEAKIEKETKYIVSGIHKDRLKISLKKGKYASLKCDLTTKTPHFWEKLKVIFSLLNHIFDKSYWDTHVSKLNTIKEYEDDVIKLRSLVEEYNQSVAQYEKIDGQLITNRDETKTIEATEDNLAKLIKKIEKANASLKK